MVKQLEESELEKKRREFFKRVEEEAKLPPPFIVEEELEWAKEVTDGKKGFWCPPGENPLYCESQKCENEVYDKCIEFLEARLLIHKFEYREVRVYRTNRDVILE